MPGHKLPKQGDIYRIRLNPTEGREIQGDARPVLVISNAEFNSVGLVIVAPITQGGEFSRFAGFAVSLSGTGLDTQGVVLSNMLRSVDLPKRNPQFIEHAPDYVLDEVLGRIEAFIAKSQASARTPIERYARQRLNVRMNSLKNNAQGGNK